MSNQENPGKTSPFEYLMQEYGIRLGIPINEAMYSNYGYQEIQIPPIPHIFFCRDLFLLQDDINAHQFRRELGSNSKQSGDIPSPNEMTIIDSDGNSNTAIHLNDVVALLSHEDITESNSQKNTQAQGNSLPEKISAIINDYEKTAVKTNWPPLDAVIIGRPYRTAQQNVYSLDQVSQTWTLPYIYSTTTASVLTHTNINSFARPQGATLVVRTRGWNNIGHWLSYWAGHPRHLTHSPIPNWAVKLRPI